MAYDTAKLVVQSSAAACTPLKDMFLCLKDEAKYVRDLEDNLTKLTADVATIYSRKKQIDRILEMYVSKEKSDEYHILLKQIEVFHKKYSKFVSKYHKACKNLPSPVSEIDVSASSSVIDNLQERKPTIRTRKFFTLASLSRDIVKLHDHISQVIDRMKPENLMLEKKPELAQVKHDDIDLPSLSEYVNKVLRYLREDENKSIGIVGLIGVGKTTVMKKLNNQLKDLSSPLSNGNMSLKFDVVIWINYPKELDAVDKIVEMMQDVIMGRLKLNQDKANRIEQNADIISTALCQKKYILLIDQVSSTIDLDEVGIRKDHKFRKVVVASSNNKVINQMTDQVVKIQTLSHDDALNLFQKVSGRIYDQRIREITDKIIESCGGLPLVIKLVATYLKGEKDENVWNGVKRMLQSEIKAAKLLKLGGVGNAYKLVYDGLKENYMKKCLLFAALFPNDHKIYKDYLVECWMAERFLDTSDTDIQKLRTAREHGATVLRELTDGYLLERCSDKYVKMPVYFRKVALEQTYPDEENCVVWVPEKDKLLEAENWRTTMRMSLICCKSKLPESPEGHNISTLLLQRNPELVTLGDLFFLNMQNLRVLDLHRTGIESLPSSFSNSVNLVSLYLNDCSRLAKLPPRVDKLEKLEILDIRGTSILSLPDEIGDMANLRCLRVSFGQNRCNRNSKEKEVNVMIPSKIINRLQNLEEFTIEMGCCSQGWNDIADRIADELAKLEHLTTIRFNFPSVLSLKNFVGSSKSWKNKETTWGNNTFRSFKIFIGCHEMRNPYGSDISGISAERHLRFSTNEEISSVKQVLKQASVFELVGHLGVKSLSEFDLENTGALKVCIVERCNKLLSIVDADKTDELRLGIMEEAAGAVLQCLEKLHLFDLMSLQSIWKGPVFPGSLSNLKVLTLSGCPELTEILNYELAKALSSLEHLKVENCSKIVDIVKVEISDTQEQVDISDILHKVEIVELVNLPEVQSICRSTSLNWKSLRKIVIGSCSKLTNVSLTLSNSEKLETIQCEASWWTTIQLSDEEKQHFGHLCDFIIMEPPPAVGAHTQGESSSRVRSDNPQDSNNMDSQTYNGDNIPKEVIMPSNGSSNAFATSNIIAVDGAARPEVNAKISEDCLASNIVAQAKSSVEDSEVKSVPRVESATCQSSCSEELLCKNGSVKIHSIEMYSLTNTS